MKQAFEYPEAPDYEGWKVTATVSVRLEVDISEVPLLRDTAMQRSFLEVMRPQDEALDVLTEALHDHPLIRLTDQEPRVVRVRLRSMKAPHAQ